MKPSQSAVLRPLPSTQTQLSAQHLLRGCALELGVSQQSVEDELIHSSSVRAATPGPG